MCADFRKESTFVRLDGGEIVRVETWRSVSKSKVNHNSNKAQE